MLPSMRADGTNSCMRLRHRRKVDFPQPLGPMMAVMLLGRTPRLILKRTCFSPYQTHTSFASKASCSAMVDVKDIEAGVGVEAWRAADGRDILEVVMGQKGLRLVARQETHGDVKQENELDEHECSRPGLAVIVVERRGRERINLERQGRNRLPETAIPKIVAERGEEQGGRLARHARKGQEQRGDNPL